MDAGNRHSIRIDWSLYHARKCHGYDYLGRPTFRTFSLWIVQRCEENSRITPPLQKTAVWRFFALVVARYEWRCFSSNLGGFTTFHGHIKEKAPSEDSAFPPPDQPTLLERLLALVAVPLARGTKELEC